MFVFFKGCLQFVETCVFLATCPLKDVFHVVGAHIGKSYFTFQGWVGGTMFSPPGGF